MSSTDGPAERAGSLHHLELGVANFDAAAPFWDWLLTDLGYEPKDDWEGGRSWVLGPTYIVLKEVGGEVPHDRSNPGLDHLAFHAASREQVDRITERIRTTEEARLLYPEDHPFAGGYYALYFQDPEGITVEIVAPDGD